MLTRRCVDACAHGGRTPASRPGRVSAPRHRAGQRSAAPAAVRPVFAPRHRDDWQPEQLPGPAENQNTCGLQTRRRGTGSRGSYDHRALEVLCEEAQCVIAVCHNYGVPLWRDLVTGAQKLEQRRAEEVAMKGELTTTFSKVLPARVGRPSTWKRSFRFSSPPRSQPFLRGLARCWHSAARGRSGCGPGHTELTSGPTGPRSSRRRPRNRSCRGRKILMFSA